MRSGPKRHRAKIVNRFGINVYEVFVPELDIVWKRHLNQLWYTPAVSHEPRCEVEDR